MITYLQVEAGLLPWVLEWAWAWGVRWSS